LRGGKCNGSVNEKNKGGMYEGWSPSISHTIDEEAVKSLKVSIKEDGNRERKLVTARTGKCGLHRFSFSQSQQWRDHREVMVSVWLSINPLKGACEKKGTTRGVEENQRGLNLGGIRTGSSSDRVLNLTHEKKALWGDNKKPAASVRIVGGGGGGVGERGGEKRKQHGGKATFSYGSVTK